MGIVSWVLIGAILGIIFSIIAGKHNTIANVAVGLVGACLAGWIATFFGIGAIATFGLWSCVIAAAGAIVLLLLLMVVQRAREA